METFPIYTFGGGEILGPIFNGMAMIFQSNNDYFTPVAELALLVGGLWAALRAFYGYNVGIFGKQWFVPTFTILTLFFTPKSSVDIIDQANPGHTYQKVDNIPSGIALISSVASNISYHVTQMIEQHIRPLHRDVYTYTKTGPLFGAKILASTKDLRLSHPSMRENVKKFTNQCYAWPFVITNIAGKRQEAIETEDILHFIDQEAHPSLGMYWDGGDGKAAFKTCKDAVPLVREALTQDQDKAILGLSTLTGYGGQDAHSLTQKMKQYGGDAWNEITKESKTVHQITSQQMMMNAYKEGYDDMRESHGHHRLYPHLVSMQATRGIMHQNMGWMVGGALAAEYLPIAQTVIFALLICAIFIVLPMSMLPGGLSVMGGWIKMIFWVQSWPIFFAILSAIGGFALQQRVVSVGSGLNLLTQASFADVAFNTYCMVQNLLLAVPFLSWAILNKGGHALVSMAERIAPSGIGNSMGASMVDNTHTFDNISMHNRTVATEQIAQQNSGALVNTGITFDQGSFAARMDGAGSQVFMETTSQLKNNVGLMETENFVLSRQAEQSLQFSKAQATEAAKQESVNTSQAIDLVERWGHGVAGMEGCSESQNALVSESLQRLHKQGVSVSDVASATDISKVSGQASAGFNLGSSIIGKALGLHGGANISGSVEAMNQDTTSFTETSDQTIDDVHRVEEALTLAKQGGVTTTDDASTALAQNARSSYDHMQQLRESSSLSKAESDRYAAAAGYTNTIGSQISTNINDDVLYYVADQKFSGDIEAAARWQSTHIGEFKERAAEYLERSGFTKRILDMAQSGDLSKEGIERAWSKSSQGMQQESQRIKESYQTSAETLRHRGQEKAIDPKALNEKTKYLQDTVARRQSDHMQEEMADALNMRPTDQSKIVSNEQRLKQKVEDKREQNKTTRMKEQLKPGASIADRIKGVSDKNE
tara:strand:+ start:2494 stop:5310 length:2817 start_codon:yes stop_codon:yes gene_type:complete